MSTEYTWSAITDNSGALHVEFAAQAGAEHQSSGSEENSARAQEIAGAKSWVRHLCF